MVTRYMEFVPKPFPGYRVRSQYSRWITRFPANGGRIFKDDNGRHPGNVLAVLYLGHTAPNYYVGEDACKLEGKYPGTGRKTTFDNINEEDYL